jgi:hypothetical protein
MRPQAIVGIGLNFLPHAADLRAALTELPTIFSKGKPQPGRLRRT